MDSRQKLWLSSFFCNFNNVISRFECFCETPLAQFFKFSDSKNKNANKKNFRKKKFSYTKTNVKNFCDIFLLIGTRCGIIFHFSTIIFRIANTTYSNEQNLIVFLRVFWKYFCGFFDTENTPDRVQKYFWNEQIPRNGCQDIILKVIIPNAKIPNAAITNAIIPNVTSNGSPN